MQYDEALAHVRDNLTHPQVHRLLNAISARHSILRDLRSALVTVGSDIVIEGTISNARYATGLSGTVQAIYDDKYADLLLDEKSTKALASGKGSTAHPGAATTDRYTFTGLPLSACAVTDPDESFAELVGFLLGQATPQELESLDKARKQRIDALADGLEVGDSVMLANIQRKYLAGLTGTVKTVDRAKKRFSLLLDESSTDRLRYHGRNNRIDIPYGVKEYLLPQVAVACALITSKR